MYRIEQLKVGEGFLCTQECILFVLKGEVALIECGHIDKRLTAPSHFYMEGKDEYSVTAVKVSQLIIIYLRNN